MKDEGNKPITSYTGHERSIIIEGGLAHALRFSEALATAVIAERLQDITISAIPGDQTSGLFFHDDINGVGVRVTMNSSNGRGSMFMGVCRDDFDYPHRFPRDGLVPFEWDEEDLPRAVARAVEFFKLHRQHSGVGKVDPLLAHTFSFRALSQRDIEYFILEWGSLAPKAALQITLYPDPENPDVYVEMACNRSLEEVRNIMRGVVNHTTMLRTLRECKLIDNSLGRDDEPE